MALGLAAVTSYGLKRIYRAAVFTLLKLSAVPVYHSALAEGSTYYHLKSASNGSVVVYDHAGTPIWCIEKPHIFSSTWNVLTTESRTLVARIHLGTTSRFVQFLLNPEIKRAHFERDWHCGMMFNCQFSLEDGTSFVWTKQTQFLEEILRSSEGKELRRRVARANRLRPWTFDWEIVVSSEISPLIALVTAFIPMQSQWDKRQSQSSTGISLKGHTFGSEAVASRQVGHWSEDWTPSKLVYQQEPTDMSFFNPPRFAKL